jgi:hypothetical protein
VFAFHFEALLAALALVDEGNARRGNGALAFKDFARTWGYLLIGASVGIPLFMHGKG